MNLSSSLKTGLSWLVGVVCMVVCMAVVGVGYMVLAKVPANQLLNVAGLILVSALVGAKAMGWSKSLATWVRSLLGV